MRVLFMGTSDFAAKVLDCLSLHNDIVGVFTAPDKVRGRGNKLMASPVAELSGQKNLATYKPLSLKTEETMELIAHLNPEVICVAAYGKILPKEVIDFPAMGCFNVHGSLLPRWRGAAPIERALLAGDEYQGVCIMRMEEGLDTGAYCMSYQTPVLEKNAEELSNELSQKGGELLCEVLDQLKTLHSPEELNWCAQCEEEVTYAEKIEAHELNVSPDFEVGQILARVRASNVAHPSKAVLAGKKVTLLQLASYSDEQIMDVSPGQVRLWKKRLILSCADGLVEVLSLKPDGKKEMQGAAFAAGIQGIKQSPAKWGSLE